MLWWYIAEYFAIGIGFVLSWWQIEKNIMFKAYLAETQPGKATIAQWSKYCTQKMTMVSSCNSDLRIAFVLFAPETPRHRRHKT